MKAILVKDDDKRSLVWSDVPDPVMSDEDVLVKIEYAALNRADLMQREGDYPPPPGCPDWMGLEISGTVEKVGATAAKLSDWKPGDKVCALLGGGGYAQHVTVKYDMLMPVPENCSMAEAAAMPEAFATAYLNLFWEGKIESGNTLLMNAGASGLASVVIPMAKAFGVRVITTVLNKRIAESITHLGADVVVNTDEMDIVEVLKQQLEDGHSVDVAIDCLGGEVMGRCLPYLTHGARDHDSGACRKRNIDRSQKYICKKRPYHRQHFTLKDACGQGSDTFRAGQKSMAKGIKRRSQTDFI